MKKLILLISLIWSFAASAQVKQPYNQYGSIWKRLQADSAFRLPKGVVGVKDANAGLDTAQMYYRKTDSSIRVWTGSKWLTFLDSARSGSGGSTNSNIGSGFRLAVPNTNNIKTLFGITPLVWDSASNSNALTVGINGLSGYGSAGQLVRSTGSALEYFTANYLLPGDSAAMLAGYVRKTRTLTINGVAFDLSADRSWTTEVPLTFQHSLTRSSNTINLVNDQASPGNLYFYGTNGSGTKGWLLQNTIGIPINNIAAASATNDVNHAAYGQVHRWNSLTSGSGFSFLSSSTAATGNTQAVVSIGLSGNNANSGEITRALMVSNAHGGTTPTNYGVQATVTAASGATGAAVHGVTSGAGTTKGVYGESDGNGSVPIGVEGFASNSGNTLGRGVWGHTEASNGAGVFGSTNGTGFGGYFENNGAGPGLVVGTGKVGIGITSPAASSIVDITSTTAGFLFPRMNATQMNAISSPATWLTVWNTDSATLCYYNGSAWLKIAGGTGGGGSGTVNTGAANKLAFYPSGGTTVDDHPELEAYTGTNPRFVSNGARILEYQGTDVASSAGAIAVGDGNTFEITGTAAITRISNVNWQNGSTIKLLFTSTATLTDGSGNSGTDIGIELATNANHTAAAGDIITLLLSEIGGTQRWREVAVGGSITTDATGNPIASTSGNVMTLRSLVEAGPIDITNNSTTVTIDCPTCVTAAGTLTSNGLMIGQGSKASAVTTTGTGVLTALGVNTGSSGSFVVNGGALGTPSSGTLTNVTGLPISTGVSGLGTGIATFLATPSSANFYSALTDESGAAGVVPRFNLTSAAQGDIIYYNGTNWVNLSPGTSGYFLKSQGAGANPVWDAAGGSGTVTSFTFTDANGFDGTVTNSTTTPTLSLTTTAANKAFMHSTSGAVTGSAMLSQETDQILVTGADAASTTPFVVNGNESLTGRIAEFQMAGSMRLGIHSTGYVDMIEMSAPGTPSSGYGRLYAKSSDGKLYWKDDAGTEYDLTGGGGGGYTNLTQFVAQTNWRTFYSNGSGDVTELAFGSAGDVFMSNGTTSAPSFQASTGTGNFVRAGSPALTGTATAVNLTYTGQISSSAVTLTDGGTVTWDWSAGTNAAVTLAGNRTLSITNAVAGTYATLRVIQDGTGSRTLAMPGSGATKVANGGAGVVTLTTTASAIDLLSFYYDGTNYYVSYGRNYN